MSKNILVIAAHTDDEALGCAGTIAKHTAQKDDVHSVFMTNGVSSRKTSKNKDIVEREQAAQKAMKILGIQSVTQFDYPDNQMDTLPLLQVTQSLEEIIHRIKPEIIYTHHFGDLNVDHQVTHKAVMTACRPQPGSSVREIYAFEVLSSTEWQTSHLAPFLPNTYIDISNYIHLKEQALNCYAKELRSSPHTRCIENCINNNKVRGHSVGVLYAEAFYAIRILKCD